MRFYGFPQSAPSSPRKLPICLNPLWPNGGQKPKGHIVNLREMLSESSCISWELSLVQSLNRQNISVTYSPHCRTWGLLKPYTKNSHVEHPVPLVVPLQSTGARHCPQLSFCRKNSTHGRSGTFSFCYCFLYCKDNVLDTSHFKTAQETFIDMPFHSSSSNQSPEASLKVIALSFLEYKS